MCRVSGEGGVGMSFLSDNHFAQIEGIKEESILLLRNFYKVSKQNNPHQVSHNMCVLTLEKLKNYTICTQITSTQISRAITSLLVPLIIAQIPLNFKVELDG